MPFVPAPPTWSEIAVSQVRGQSVLTTCRNVQPLKVLNPRAPAGSCHVVLSSYGGGMVAGDVIQLQLTAHAGTRLFLGTQANTKIFRSVGGQVAEQTINGFLESNALVAVLPDPVVLQAHSRYRQRQHWHLAPDAVLLLADWFHSGRIDNGEQFAFTSFESELRVTVGGRLTVLDRFNFQPAEHIATSPANFDRYQTALSVYLVGHPTDDRFRQLASTLAELQTISREALPEDLSEQEFVVAVAPAKPGVLVLRALGTSRQALQPVYERLGQALAETELLAHHPGQRKY
ncbi:urease accessory protein UreD [Hymenobacter taeanensis]|uniref:Urease accessory protein UreD n=1 Tax=Hymenobacter taeanensis TaxID=2735321 RepID=A0A6M6BHE6_9BACT|nr:MULTISPECIES: urease accessory protein UreD [Hymenobacter]QJX47318.1 urease accessory protein UreD [Hymenobacter taeanensis]UOQ79345.1 urease accessory protein UreD [Hymenobacter sp. 5414T-23]